MARLSFARSRAVQSIDERRLGHATLVDLSRALRCDRLSSGALIDQALDAATAPDGEGAIVFTRIYVKDAREGAEVADARRRAGHTLSMLQGIPISIKDAFDVAGEATLAGSKVLRIRSSADVDATVVSRLKAAGAVIVGRTNMSELGVSALGVNLHCGTPRNPFDRVQGRIPGGSSSGAAVSVTDGMAAAAVCSDTGGSARIPAALCGVVGFKPTTHRIPVDGLVPLSPTFDSVGVLGPSVGCCAVLDAVLDPGALRPLRTASLRRLVFGVPTTILLDALDRHVGEAFERALRALSAAGARIVERPLPALGEIDHEAICGGIVAAEAHWWHKSLLETRASLYEPAVRGAIRAGAGVSGLGYVRLARRRNRGARQLEEGLRGYDYLLMPTVPVVAPTLQSVQENCIRSSLTNALLVRNPSLVNFLDWCALSVPCHAPGEAPVGLTVAARNGNDAMLLAVGEAVESSLAGHEVRKADPVRLRS
jgi:aspartyl-tRNA(Asn)/glutamyl-tRNA(Gln) amidotransferase subunit A